MRKSLFVLGLLLVGVVPALAVDHIHYGRQDMVGPQDIRVFPDVWDLTKCDLTITYGLEVTTYIPSHFGGTEVVMVGLNNLGGLVTTSVNAFTTDPNVFDRDDLFVLTRTPYDPFNYLAYDVKPPHIIGPAFGTENNQAFWFDRDGAGLLFPTRWGSVNGGNYNTNGKYWLSIVFHAVSPTEGTMFATINGLPQGFYLTQGPKLAPPDIYPAGRSISGNMTNVQVTAILGTFDGGKFNARIKELDVLGCLTVPIPPVRLRETQATQDRPTSSKSASKAGLGRGR